MAVIEYVTRSQAPQDVQKIYDAVEKQMGAVLGIMRALAYNRALLKSFLALNAASSQTKLEPSLRDLAYLMVSRLNGCDYCAHYHQITGRQAGLTEQQLQDVENFSSSGAYEPLQRNVLRYAEQVTRHIRPDAALVQQLKEHLSDTELMELTFTIGLANLTNRFNVALDIELP